jgi:hypothetical protein
LRDEPGDLGQSGRRADLRRANDEPPVGVQRRADDLGARLDLERDRLARKHGLVHGGCAFEHDSVGGDLLSGTDDEDIAFAQFLDRHEHLDAVAEDPRLLCAELEQRPDRGSGAPLGARLQVATEEDERRDDSRGLEVRVGVVERDHGQERPGVCGEGAERDERVHPGRALPGPGEGGAMEGPASPEDDGRREREREPLPAFELKRGHHREEDERERQRGRDRKPHRRVSTRIRTRESRAIAGGLDRADEVSRGGARWVELDGRCLHREVDARADAGELVQLLLDANGARGARHPLDRQIEPAGLSRVHETS